MKNKYILTLLGLILVGCKPETPKPENLIPEDQMVDILYDLNIFQSIRNIRYQLFITQNIDPKTYIYKKYNIDSLTLAQSNLYYISDASKYEALIDKVIARINHDKENLNSQKPESGATTIQE